MTPTHRFELLQSLERSRLWLLALGTWVVTFALAGCGGRPPEAPGEVAAQLKEVAKTTKPSEPVIDATCSAVVVLAGLTDSERRVLVDACTASRAGGKGKLDDGVLSPILERLKFEPPWQTSLLLRMLGNSLPIGGIPAWDAVAQKLKAKASPCKKALAALALDAKQRQQGELVSPPLAKDTLTEPGCIGKEKLDDQVFLVLPGGVEDVVDVAWGDKQGWHARRIQTWVDVDGYRYWFALLPEGSQVVVRQQGRDPLLPPRVFAQHATGNYVTPARRDENARFCVQFEGVGVAALVLLDGDVVPLEGRRQANAGGSYFAARRFVRRGPHSFTVLDDAGRVKAEASIAPEDLTETGCVVRRFDLTPQHSSALLISAEPSCASMGAVQPRVYSYAKKFLQETLRSTKDSDEIVSDAEPYATAIGAIARLNGTMQSLGALARGGSRGNQDSTAVMQGLAGELLRKGFSKAYIGHLSCGRVGPEPAFTFGILRLDLQKAYSMTTDEVGNTEDDPGVLDSEQETVTDLNDLRDLIRAPLSRLLKRPYARLLASSRVNRVFKDPTQRVETWKPPWPSDGSKEPVIGATLRVLKLNVDGDTSMRCADIARERSLITPESLPEEDPNNRQNRELIHQFDIPIVMPEARHGVPRQQNLRLEVDTPGTYVIELQAYSGHDSLPVTRTCVWVSGDEARARYGLQLGVSPELYPTAQSHGGGGAQSQVVATVTPPAWSYGSRFAWSTPVIVGYSTVDRSMPTPPSWFDLSHHPPFTDEGTLTSTWRRRSFLLGFRSDFEWRFLCNVADVWRYLSASVDRPEQRGVACPNFLNRIRMFTHWSMMLDGGWISASNVAPALRDFYDQQPADSSLIDVDLSAAMQIGFSARVSSHLDVAAGLQLAWLGFDDFIAGGRRSIRYDSLFAPGFIFELGYHP